MSGVRVAVSQPLADLEARWAAEDLGRLGGVRAVCVLGSSARGDFDNASDIDLLALVDDRETATAVRASFGRERAGRRVQLKLLTEPRLGRLFERRSTFAVHVLREAVVVFDPLGSFAAVRKRYSPDAPVCDNREGLLIRLELYEDLDWCQGLYLYCLSDLYSIGRAAAYSILGRDSRFEFSGMRTLRAIERHRPALAGPARRIAALRPFFLLVERDQPEALPYPYRDCHQEASEARDACRTLVQAIR